MGFDPKFKESGLNILGIIVDADDSPDSRWASIVRLCGHAVPSLPEKLPKEGFIADTPSGVRFGFWMMPDCSSAGMIESFLRHLVPPKFEELWQHALGSFDRAKELGAACRDSHCEKARIHTWLAWQDPPGERLGTALRQKILDPLADTALPFVTWFTKLYKLEALQGVRSRK